MSPPDTYELNAGLATQDTAIAESSDFFALLKPRVMSLVIFTAFVGLIMAPGELHPVLSLTAILTIAVAAGAAGSLNMWYDADIDARMDRTRNRPIPAGRVDKGTALGFGMTLAVGAVTIMALALNWLAAGLLAFTIFFYAVVYTMWLKRRTAQNIVIGGIAGSLPPAVAWVAVTGSIDLGAVVLFAMIFFWTPAHFWALSLWCAEEYKKAGIPMLPVVAGYDETRKQILIYSLILAAVGVSPYFFNMAGPVYGVASLGLGAVFLGLAIKLFRSKEIKDAKRLFAFSILYLFSSFLLLALEKIIGGLL